MDVSQKQGYDDMKYSGGLLGRRQQPSSRSLFIFFYSMTKNLGHTARRGKVVRCLT